MSPRNTETELKNLLFALVTFNPLIIVDSESSKLPQLIQAILASPCHNFPKNIPFHFSGNYVKYQAITNWCEKNNIDCLYSLSEEKTSSELPSKIVKTSITNKDEIIQTLFSSFKQINKLKLKYCISILNGLIIESVNIKTHESSGPDNNSTEITYQNTIDLDDLTKLLKDHTDAQKSIHQK